MADGVNEMNGGNGQHGEIIRQLGWLAKIFSEYVKYGVIAAFAVALLAFYYLGLKTEQAFISRILYGKQPKLVTSQFDKSKVIRLSPVIPEKFTAEQIMKWYSTDFISDLKKLSKDRYQRLKDVAFQLEQAPDGWLIITTGKQAERPLHEHFHKMVADRLLEKLHEEEKRIERELTDRVKRLREELANIRKERKVITAEKERSVALMERFVRQAEQKADNQKRITRQLAGVGTIVVEAGRKDDLATLVLALAKKREELASQAVQIRHFLTGFDRLRKQAGPARLDMLGYTHIPEESLSFSVKLAIWIFLAFLAFLVAPFLAALVHFIRDEMKAWEIRRK